MADPPTPPGGGPPAATPRADPITPRLGLTLPSVGMDRDSWGGITNGNWSQVDSVVGAQTDTLAGLQTQINNLAAAIVNNIEVVGTMKVWPTNGQPNGWLSCDGTELSRADWADLFAAIGTTWGAGNGSTTFNIPNLQGAVIVHRGGWMPFGGSMGETTHQLTWNEMPAHNHEGDTNGVGDHTHGYSGAEIAGPPNVQAGFSGGVQGFGRQTEANGAHAHHFVTWNAGASWGHNVVQPSVGMNWIIKAVHWGF